MKDDLAFPQYEVDMYGISHFHGGMLLRDYFAAKALQGICACGPGISWGDEMIAKEAYGLADAMLKERSRCEF